LIGKNGKGKHTSGAIKIFTTNYHELNIRDENLYHELSRIGRIARI